ncbi:MAG: hypothetical protein ACE5JK_07935 [Candidatus Omnitrophota bacterium]
MAKKKLKKGLWSKEEVQVLKKDFPRKSCAEVAERLGRPLYAVKRKAYRLGIFKTKKYLKSIGRA